MQRIVILAAGALSFVWLAAAACADEKLFDVIPNQAYVERESGYLSADVYVPHGDGPFPAMLVVHGGAWASGTREQLAGAAQGLAIAGYTSAAISYRLAPQQPFPAQIYDCQAAVRWLREHAAQFKIDPNHIGGFGYSAGGHLVALLGALDDDDFREANVPKDAPSARLQVVVAGGAPCDFRVLPANSRQLAYWLGGTPGEKPEAYKQASPTNFVTADDPPMFFFHGGTDNLVPIRSPQRMVEQLKGAGVPVEFYEVPNKGHMGAVVDRDALRRAVVFADRYLKQNSAATGSGNGSIRTPTKSEPDHGK